MALSQPLSVVTLHAVRGDDFYYGFVVHDRVAEGTPDAVEVSAGVWVLPKNLTGYTGASMLRATEDGDKIADFVVSSDRDAVEALDVTGQVWLTLSAATARLLVNAAVADFELTDAAGKKSTLFKMQFTVEKDHTFTP